MSNATAYMRELVDEFEWTRPRHKGSVATAAPILSMRADTLARALQRAKAAGLAVDFTDDTKKAGKR